MKPLKEKISITIDNDILAKLKRKAEEDDRSLSQYINLILKEYLKKRELTRSKSGLQLYDLYNKKRRLPSWQAAFFSSGSDKEYGDTTEKKTEW